MSTSLRWRVLLGATLVTFVGLLVAGEIGNVMLRDGLISQLDERLALAAHGLTPAFEDDGSSVRFEWEGAGVGPQVIFRAWDASGAILAESSGTVSIPKRDSPTLLVSQSSTKTLKLSDGSNARAILINFLPKLDPHSDPLSENALASTRPAPPVTLEVAATLADVESVLALAKKRMAIVIGSALLLTIAVLWPITNIILRPVNAIADRIRSFDVSELRSRVDTTKCPTELLAIPVRLNELLGRLEESFDRERAITANVAHELRTPLAGLRATIELAETKSRSIEYYQRTLSDCGQMGRELESLVERILLLARIDAGKVAIQNDSIELESFLKSTWESVVQATNLDSTSVVWQVTKGAIVRSDPALLLIVFRNLFSNALSHGIAEHPIAIESEMDHNGIRVRIANGCDRVHESELPRLKERFYQRDLSRSQTGNHSGLGLSLCDDILKLLNGGLELNLLQEDRFQAAVFLPKHAQKHC
jgi:two-component system, OmpR family, heavy metal sensor histidine kinase CusS